MKFKGTKGKWKLANNHYGYFTSVRNSDDTRKICVSRVNNMTESNANMLLISKAPEMLAMLHKVLEENMTDYSCCMNIKNEIEQLIKESTEL